MLFVNVATYADDLDLVHRVRPAHRVYAEALRAAGQIVLAGPFASDVGALLIYEAASREEVDQFISQDPYHIQGVYAGNEVREWHLAGANRESLESIIGQLGER